MKTKMCSKCHKEKPISQFSKNKNEKDGLKRYCKECVASDTKSYRKRNLDKINLKKRQSYHQEKLEANKRTEQQLKAGSKVCSVCGVEKPMSEFYQRGNGGFYARCKECEHEAQRKFREENKDHISAQRIGYNKRRKAKIDEYNHSYYQANTESVKSRVKTWAKDNPNRFKEYRIRASQNRRAKKKAIKSDFSKTDWQKCKEFFSDQKGNRCAYCGRHMDRLTQDHVIPLDAGGSYTKDNIVPACQSCNSSKQNKEMEKWFRSKSFFSEERLKRIREYLLKQQVNTERAG